MRQGPGLWMVGMGKASLLHSSHGNVDLRIPYSIHREIKLRPKDQKQGAYLWSSSIPPSLFWGLHTCPPSAGQESETQEDDLEAPEAAPGQPHLLSLFREEYLLGWVFIADS